MLNYGEINIFSMSVTIRKGSEKDFSQVFELIKELAAYEKALNEVTTTVDKMIEDASLFTIIVAEIKNKIVGVALFFPYYSTWKGRCLYLEDIVVTEKYRQKGIGKLLFDEVSNHAKEYGAKRLMWQVLDWNEPAIHFYKKINADFDEDWINCKLTEEQIHKDN